jgi:hypothetical protein
MTDERATLEELLEFANKVRAAGGGKPLQALMPSVPQDPETCLIARNLNFECSVDDSGSHYFSPQQKENAGYEWTSSKDVAWTMHVANGETAEKIGESLSLDYITDYDEDHGWEDGFILLPARIGAVAQAFDNWMDDPDPESEFVPYIEESTREAYMDDPEFALA